MEVNAAAMRFVRHSTYMDANEVGGVFPSVFVIMNAGDVPVFGGEFLCICHVAVM